MFYCYYDDFSNNQKPLQRHIVTAPDIFNIAVNKQYSLVNCQNMI